MRSRFLVPLHALAAVALLCLAAGTAAAQDDEGGGNGEEGGLRLQGIGSVGYTHSYQATSLPAGGSFEDGNGIDLLAGFQAGHYLAFQLGFQWQGDGDYATYFVPLTVRAMSPPLLERIRLYGQFGFGLFFSKLHHEFHANENERASAYSAGGGVEIGLTEDVSGIVYGAYQKGAGGANNYESAQVGVGLQYRWDF